MKVFFAPRHQPAFAALTALSHNYPTPRPLVPGIGARQLHVRARLTCTSLRMASEQVTPFDPSSAGRAAHPSGAKDEIVDLALWKEHQHPKRPGRAGPRAILVVTRRGLKRLSRTSAVTIGVRRAPGPTDLWPGTAGRAPNGRLNSKWGDVIRQANIRELFDAGSVGSSAGVRYC